MQVTFAYDGSINGDWVSHYAMRLASHTPQRTLTLIYVDQGQLQPAEIAAKQARIRSNCERQEIALQWTPITAHRNVVQAIRHAVPHGSHSCLVCGTRLRASHQGLLRGTVSESLLADPPCYVLAVRVVQPGLLGVPRNVLVPVSGHPHGIVPGLTFLQLFAPDVSELHLLYVVPSNRDLVSQVAIDTMHSNYRLGVAYCQRIERELSDQLRTGEQIMDARVVHAESVSREIVATASRLKSHLIYLGASQRSRTERLLRGDPIETILRSAPCDVAIYRGVP
jgi:nucleotide-binding universal stress UspA family protein